MPARILPAIMRPGPQPHCEGAVPRRTVLAGLLAIPAAAAAQTEAPIFSPDRPIRIVVPTGAGGITDILARIVANRLGARLGVPVVVDNRPGASGIIGTEAVVRARPDGTTLLMVYPSHPVNPALKAHLPYDTERDLAPISIVTTVALVLLVPRDSPDQDVVGLIARARRERLNYASVGSGSLAHLAAELFRGMAGLEMTHIPFRSAPEAHTALMRGEVAMFLDPPITTLPLLRGGQVRAIGVTTRSRMAALPEVPTIAEAALPGYEVLGWNGLLAPAGTPAPIIARLNEELRGILAEPEIRRRLAQHGTEPAPTTPEEFAAIIHADIAKWGRVVREAGINPD
ncbi:tripartite tricarboxylate transporter substrate binding protein [Siccirubricoccus sp. G192]|uniref:tripartite tricarboxylate transporter substrate binding protein n=1 Tax=Siccirubricoccus sp. G192 TaxID=2849651 RepID=UPI001C2C896A|nr:tripartite tricarboxylate transporter substrate binding protein [Siccirubricoccus sp. G192]MBV1798349.1 tripartite tricarboxylate transporter substrate binding protein [Siccirubricoccus sp. G192]